MNEPLGEREVLCVSQFTLYARRPARQPPELCRRRPTGRSRSRCMSGSASGSAPGAGCSAAMMAVELVNDGPVTVIVENPR